MSIKINRYKQNSQKFISFNIDFESLNKISKVLVYEKDPGGYQRQPNNIHINKIKKYILENEDFLLPTSIILGVDNKQITDYIDKSDNLIVSEIPEGTFRIVDGQHRIKGIAKAIDESTPERQKVLNAFTFNVICVLTDESTRSTELEIFVDINSKGKKVSTDLAELAKYNYQIIEKKVSNNFNSIAEHIAMKVARELRENVPEGVWHYAIKFDIHSRLNIGIIGVSSFRKSITRSIQLLLEKDHAKIIEFSGQELINECDEIAKTYTDFYAKCWNNVVHDKWSKCFKKKQVLDEFENFVTIEYSKEHYIQKPLGVKSINKIIEEIISENPKSDLDQIREYFRVVIENSKVKIENWSIGKTFSGLNSEGGFKKIRQMIKGELELPKS